MTIQFLGAAREVTGSKHLVTTGNGKKILFDCGLFQGKGLETDARNRNLGIDPAEVNHIILTHAHIDHSGLIPWFYKNGFEGSVITTSATRDLCTLMLADSGHIHEQDIVTFNKKRARQGLLPVEPLYTREDAIACMKLFIGIPYNRKLRIDDSTRVWFTNSGHMLGSGVATLEVNENGTKKIISFTGDIGRPVNRIVRPPDPFPQSDILITESTYGDRLHTPLADSDEELLRVVKYTCIEKMGKLIIPSFAVGRTQELVLSLNNLWNEGRLPRIDVFVDSPLAMNITDVFRLHPECFNEEVRKVLATDPDPFGFGTLHYIQSVEESKTLNSRTEPCIIISSSGMMEAGRVKHHLANTISDSRNTVLVVGYCAPQTLGARILRGDEEVSIHGNRYPVRAEIFRIESFSGHGDYQEMLSYLSCQKSELLREIFLVHGELHAQEFFKDHLERKGFRNILIPEQNAVFSI